MKVVFYSIKVPSEPDGVPILQDDFETFDTSEQAIERYGNLLKLENVYCVGMGNIEQATEPQWTDSPRNLQTKAKCEVMDRTVKVKFTATTVTNVKCSKIVKVPQQFSHLSDDDLKYDQGFENYLDSYGREQIHIGEYFEDDDQSGDWSYEGVQVLSGEQS